MHASLPALSPPLRIIACCSSRMDSWYEREEREFTSSGLSSRAQPPSTVTSMRKGNLTTGRSFSLLLLTREMEEHNDYLSKKVPQNIGIRVHVKLSPSPDSLGRSGLFR